MEYFIIERHKHCIAELDNHDACGIQCHRGILLTRRKAVLYFTGNFWWANSAYLCGLPKIEDLYRFDRYNAEFWINDGLGDFKIFYECSMSMAHDILSIMKEYPVEAIKAT